MKTPRVPVTAAVRALRASAVTFECHLYAYIDGGGTARVARELGVDEHGVIKTLIMEDERGEPLIALMHGDRQVNTQALARARGVKRVGPCEPGLAERHSGYQVGGTSPFATRRPMPVYCEAGIADLGRIYINGGKRGFIVSLAAADALALLRPTLVAMAV